MSRLKQSKDACEKLKKDAAKNAKHIRYESFGTDGTKTNKNEDGCARGKSSGSARYCSAHIRKIYSANLLGDNEMSEFCVNGRHESNRISNECELCRVNVAENHGTINFAEALLLAMDGNNDKTDPEKRKQRLMAFMEHFIKEKYPGNGAGDESSLRIKVNGGIWVEYYIKLIPHSSLLKTSAPSGYKYKDRISIGRVIKIQGNSNKNLLFFLSKDPAYNDPEYEATRPVVNCVGFWNLLEAGHHGEIRNIIHLNKEQMVNINFGFVFNPQSGVNSIELELIAGQSPISLWQWECNDNPAPMDQVEERKEFVDEANNESGNVMVNGDNYQYVADNHETIDGDGVHVQSRPFLTEILNHEQAVRMINESGHHSDTSNSSPSLEPSSSPTISHGAPQSVSPPHHPQQFPLAAAHPRSYQQQSVSLNPPFYNQTSPQSVYYTGHQQQVPYAQPQQPPNYQSGSVPVQQPMAAHQPYYNGNPQQQQAPNYHPGHSPSDNIVSNTYGAPGMNGFNHNGITAPDLPPRTDTFEMRGFTGNMTPAPLSNIVENTPSVFYPNIDNLDDVQSISYGPNRASFNATNTLFRYNPMFRPQSTTTFNDGFYNPSLGLPSTTTFNLF